MHSKFKYSPIENVLKNNGKPFGMVRSLKVILHSRKEELFKLLNHICSSMQILNEVLASLEIKILFLGTSVFTKC
jgi:hypothetical protein